MMLIMGNILRSQAEDKPEEDGKDKFGTLMLFSLKRGEAKPLLWRCARKARRKRRGKASLHRVPYNIMSVDNGTSIGGGASGCALEGMDMRGSLNGMPSDLNRGSYASSNTPFGSGLRLMARQEGSPELYNLMIKMAEFEHGDATGKKFRMLRKKWMKKVIGLEELDSVPTEAKKKLALDLFNDFMEFIYSKENLHTNVDDIRALLRRLSEMESSRDVDLEIENLPNNFIGQFFSPSSPVFEEMKELVSLYSDNQFRTYMRRVVDDAFTSEMASPQMSDMTQEESAPAGSLLSKVDPT
jgi:hypothetical protein